MKFTPTQQKIIDILSDGQRHTAQELFDCLPDELGYIDNLTQHISNIRNRLKPIGQWIVCETANKRRYYRHVRLLAKVE